MIHADVNPYPPGSSEAIKWAAAHDARFTTSRNGDDEEVPDVGNFSLVEATGGNWYLDAADLLEQPDPGPTAWLVEGLIVEQALVAMVGRWKTTKSYGLLELCIAIATGRPAFGVLEVRQGPVVFVNEESGKAALWRRLDALCRGRAIDPEELRGRLYVSANARVKLDDPHWQNELVDLGKELGPALYAFDPLARMKASARDENAQKDMAAVVEFWRYLREETRAAVGLVQHTGHVGGHMRGSSDLESAWESRLAWERDGQSPLVTIKSEHREAEASPPIRYRIGWDHETRTMRFELEPDTLEQAVRAYLAEHPDASANEVFEQLGGSRPKVLAEVKRQREQGGTEPGYHPGTAPSQAPPRGGTAGAPFRGPGTTIEAPGTSKPVPPPQNGRPRPLLGDPGYALYIDAASTAGHLTEGELREQQTLATVIHKTRQTA